ncbi:MAG: hypothetical protein HKM24_05220 [Gammaproteobacteria bacterium]|nr:hypothetical protein [Gammaproteobacteria bacterium]
MKKTISFSAFACIVLLTTNGAFAWQISPGTIDMVRGDCGYVDPNPVAGRRSVIPIELTEEKPSHLLMTPIQLVGSSSDCYLGFTTHNGVKVGLHGVGEWHFELVFDDSHLSERQKKRQRKKDFFYGQAPEFWKMKLTPIKGNARVVLENDRQKVEVILPDRQVLEPYGKGAFGVEVGDSCSVTLRTCDKGVKWRQSLNNFANLEFPKC